MPVQTTDQWHPGAREYFCEPPAENCSGLLEIVPSCRLAAHNRPRQMMEKLSIALRHQNLSSASRLETQNQQISTNTFIESVIYHVAKINPLARSIHHRTQMLAGGYFCFDQLFIWLSLWVSDPCGVCGLPRPGQCESNQPPAWPRLHPRKPENTLAIPGHGRDNCPNKVNKLCFDSSVDNSDLPTATFENNNNTFWVYKLINTFFFWKNIF